MKIVSLSTFLLCALGGLAQQVHIVSPAPNTRIVSGQPFTATVAIASTTSSVDVIALVFGAKFINPQAPETVELGQTRLTTLVAPTFPIGGPTGMQQNVQLTFPVDLITGLNTTYNLTCGEFFTLGAENTPLTLTSQVPVFVASP
ncbi:hypothetical protein JB92DRAFT_3127710 [Gautieria morchelliformis]|nr:hypothetical protein JB92DRAFT_3127710 [Gautieria morchelliformis]